MATTKVSGELVDLRGGLPDFSLAATNTVSYLNAGGGNQYNFNGAYGLYGVVNGTYVLSSVSSSHPIAILNNGKTSLISYTGAVNEGSQTGPDGNTYTYYSGDVTITVSGNFDVVSYACKVHGYMGGQNNLIYTNLHSDLGLKIPSGTEFNRPATDVAGMIRNNTNETSDNSASCEEYYNGTAWKKINNVTIPTYFKTIAFTGNGGTQSITGFGFKPDFLWIKSTSGNTYSHVLTDSSRGVNRQVYSNDSSAETTYVSNVTSFDADGFSLGSATDSNASGANYLAYGWQANGGTTSSNTNGSITSTVQVNTNLGFSIVTYTGTGSSATVGHGLSSAPEFIIVKNRSGNYSWTTGSSVLNDANAYSDLNANKWSQSGTPWSSTQPTSSVFSLGTYVAVNGSGQNMIAYCFHSVAGYSKMGTYTGTGSSNSITGLGFQPSWVMIKCTSVGPEDWPIFSTALPNNYVVANTGATAQSFTFPFDSDGFTVPASSGMTNANGENYIYMAFK